MKVLHVNHIGINFNDLEIAKDFFVDLGFKVVGRATVGGEWVGRVIGLEDVRSEIVMLQAPDEKLNLELVRFIHPTYPGKPEPLPANAPGLRHLTFEVDDIDGIVAKLKEKGFEAFSPVENYENFYKLCYVRGPEGIIVELAEEVG